MELEITKNELYWTAKIKGSNHDQTEFEYIRDEAGDIWLFNMSVYGDLKCKGIGRQMLKAAVEHYGKVYINNMDRPDYNEKFKGKGYSSSYLCQDGPGFIQKMIQEGIIQYSWLREPDYPLCKK